MSEDAVALAELFGRTAKLLSRRLDEALGSALSTPRARILVEVAQNGPLRISDVASRIGISQGTASTLADGLSAEALVERTPDPLDRRATLLQATPSGTERAADWADRYAGTARTLFGVLDDRDRRALAMILAQLEDAADSSPSAET